MLRVMVLGLALMLGAVAAEAQAVMREGLSALARVVPRSERVRVFADGQVQLDLGLSQAVPWRVRVLDDPARLVLDFRELDFAGLDRARLIGAGAGRLLDLRAGPLRAGWSRLVIEMDAPFAIVQAGMRTGLGADGAEARLSVRLGLDRAGDFGARARLPDPPGWAMPAPMVGEMVRPGRGVGPVVVVLDPGHGGIDPGAERGGTSEAAIVLTFARELKEALLRDGGFAVVMTREADVFVPLETRIAIASAVGANVFVSLHADAIEEGEARGAAIYTLAATATDAASAALAARHDRDSVMSGVDLSGQDDVVAGVLMDLARQETGPRSVHLAQELLLAMKTNEIILHRVPQRQAGFSVLKLPHVPSVLVELGYMSSEGDFRRLTDPAWRARMAQAIVQGLSEWAMRDAALSDLRRQ